MKPNASWASKATASRASTAAASSWTSSPTRFCACALLLLACSSSGSAPLDGARSEDSFGPSAPDGALAESPGSDTSSGSTATVDASPPLDVAMSGRPDAALSPGPDGSSTDQARGAPVCGKPGNHSLSFSGQQVVSVPDSPTLHLSDITVEAWATWTGGTTTYRYDTIVAKPYGTATGDSFGLWYESGGLHAGANPTNTGNAIGYPFNPIPGRWYHTAFTYDSKTKQQKLYVDGLLVASGTAAGGDPAYDKHPLYIGADTDNEKFDGAHVRLIDEVRIWTSVRSAAQIAADISECTPGAVPGLAAYFPLDEGMGTATHDVSGNGNDGQLGGGDPRGPDWSQESPPFGGERDR